MRPRAGWLVKWSDTNGLHHVIYRDQDEARGHHARLAEAGANVLIGGLTLGEAAHLRAQESKSAGKFAEQRGEET